MTARRAVAVHVAVWLVLVAVIVLSVACHAPVPCRRPVVGMSARCSR